MSKRRREDMDSENGIVKLVDRIGDLNDDSSDDSSSKRPYTRRKIVNNIKLKELKCFEEVDRMVKAGEYCRNIATYIQEDAGEYLDVSFESLVRTVYRYKKMLENGGIIVKEVEERDEDDPYYQLRVLEDMFEKQCRRIDLEVETEVSLNKLFSTTHKEFEILNTMGANILKLKKSLNLIGSSSSRKSNKGYSGKLDVARIIESPESRHKVLSFVETMIGNPDLMDDLLAAKDSIKLSEAQEVTEEEVVEEVAKKKTKKKVGSRNKKIDKIKNRLKKKNNK